MTDPHNELRKYLKELIRRFVLIKRIMQEIRTINEWQSPLKVEALNIGSAFYGLVIFSFQQTILTELTKMVSMRNSSDKSAEKKSLIDWLDKARQNAKQLAPRKAMLVVGEGKENFIIRDLNQSEYRNIVDEHLRLLAEYNETILKVKHIRDKSIAHSDSVYFNNPEKILEDYPVNRSELELLIDKIDQILKEHNDCLFSEGIMFENIPGINVEDVLSKSRAWHRVLTSGVLRKKGISPNLFVKDDFDPDHFKSEP